MPSFLKVEYLKTKGRVGRRVKIGFGSMIVAKHVEIGDDVRLGFGTHIVGESVKLGERVWIGNNNQVRVRRLEMDDESEITNYVTVGGMDSPSSCLLVGKRSSIMVHSFVNTTFPVEIGNDVGIGGYTKLFTHGSWQNVLEGYPIEFGPVRIEDNVWIPWDVFVLPNVTIGKGSTIGARALIKDSVPPNSLAVGIPARVIKTAPNYPKLLTEDERLKWIDRIMNEMQEYFTWKGWRIGITRQNQFVWCATADGGERVLIFWEQSEPVSSPRIDLKMRVDSLDLSKRWHREIRSFLGRYGIRTEHTVNIS
jgi:acetyltransferase-like isoleucine patch superfamily enzyme